MPQEKTYKQSIEEEIDRIKKLHGEKDPYYLMIMNGLLSDLAAYENSDRRFIVQEEKASMKMIQDIVERLKQIGLWF